MNIVRNNTKEADSSTQPITGFIKHLNDNLFQDADAKISEMDWNVGHSSIRSIWESCDLSASEFADEVAAYYRRPRMALPELLAAPSLVGRFTRRFLRETMIFPYDVGGGRFGLAVADPTDVAAQRGAEIVLGGPVAVSIASFEDIGAALFERLGSDEDGPSASSPVLAAGAVEESVDSLRDLASGAPVVRAVNDLVEKAVELRASDIHIEPMRNGLTVRMRVDGLLRAVPAPAHALPQALISRIKILAGLNIAERRLPQDGAARLEAAGLNLDVRVAIMPTQHGETAVIRLLPRDRGLLDIAKLGLRAHDERKVRRLIELPHGMIVITGPTGSGKTTTLATMLSALNTPFAQDTDHRGPGRIRDRRHQPVSGQTGDRPHLCFGIARLRSARPGRNHGRRDPRRRDGEHCYPRGVDRASRFDDVAHGNRDRGGAAPSRSRRRGILVEIDAAGRHRAAAGPHPVRSVQGRGKKFPQRISTADPRYEACGLSVGETVFEPRGCERCAGVGLSRPRRRV